MSLKEDLTKLAALKRSRGNFEKIQEQIESLRGLVDEAETAAEEYADVAEDPDYDADDRDASWMVLCDALKAIAEA